MNVKSLILEKIKKQGEVKSADIVKASAFSRAYINRFFQELREEGKIVLIGRANRARYVFNDERSIKRAKENILTFRRILKNKFISEDLVLNEIKQKTGIFSGLSGNIVQILNYAFSEMLNNAIEHSQSKIIGVFMEKRNGLIRFSVVDKGIGIFNNIMRKRKLKNRLEAIQDLIKGKQTTMPDKHTGEGIFFTSKIADKLVIQSSRKRLTFDNLVKDIFVSDAKDTKGTKVNFVIKRNSKRSLSAVFEKYSGKMFDFSKTEVIVRLYKTGVEYVSRSQARRIVSGLEKFKTIILDFKGVKTVGQAFADEIFRVWQNQHPDIKIREKNAGENVLFMLKGALDRN